MVGISGIYLSAEQQGETVGIVIVIALLLVYLFS
jgi:hypothetical protein